MKKINFLIVLIILPVLLSCNRNVEDTSELWAKAQTSQAIIDRSGTVFPSGNTDTQKELAMKDAENRLRTGGGLFGKKPGLPFGDNAGESTSGVGIGMPINPYLWKGSIDTIDFMPLSSADPFGGTIITDWYIDGSNTNQRCKINIFIKGVELKTSNLKVNSFCQSFTENKWVDIPVNTENNLKLENAILNKAKKIKLAQG